MVPKLSNRQSDCPVLSPQKYETWTDYTLINVAIKLKNLEKSRKVITCQDSQAGTVLMGVYNYQTSRDGVDVVLPSFLITRAFWWPVSFASNELEKDKQKQTSQNPRMLKSLLNYSLNRMRWSLRIKSVKTVLWFVKPYFCRVKEEFSISTFN